MTHAYGALETFHKGYYQGCGSITPPHTTRVMVRDGETPRLHLESNGGKKSVTGCHLCHDEMCPMVARWMDNGHVFLVDGMGWGVFVAKLHPRVKKKLQLENNGMGKPLRTEFA